MPPRADLRPISGHNGCLRIIWLTGRKLSKFVRPRRAAIAGDDTTDAGFPISASGRRAAGARSANLRAADSRAAAARMHPETGSAGPRVRYSRRVPEGHVKTQTGRAAIARLVVWFLF